MQTVVSHGVQLAIACVTNAQETCEALKAKLMEMPRPYAIGGLLVEVTDAAAQHYGIDPFVTVSARLGDYGLEFIANDSAVFWPNVVIGVFATRNTVTDVVVQPELDLSSVIESVEHEPIPVEEEPVAEEPVEEPVAEVVPTKIAGIPAGIPSKQQQQFDQRQQKQNFRKG